MKRFLMTACLTVQGLVVGTAMAAEPIGQVISLTGQATVTANDGQAQQLAMKSEVYLNDRIETKADSRLQIMLTDDAIISLGAGSSMTLDEYVYNVLDQEDNASTVTFLKGVFRVITAKIADMNPERFKVKSNMATVGIRGCELCFNIGDEEESVQIVRLPEGKLIRFDSLIGFGSFDVRQQGIAVDIDTSGFYERQMTADEATVLISATTPVLKEEDNTTVASDDSESIGDNNALSADAVEVDEGVDVADSSVAMDAGEEIVSEGSSEAVVEDVDTVVERVATTADRRTDELEMMAGEASEFVMSEDMDSVMDESMDAGSDPAVDEPVVVDPNPEPVFPQEGTPVQVAFGAGNGWSWGVWEQTDVLNAEGDTKVSFQTQVRQEPVDMAALNTLFTSSIVTLQGPIDAAAGVVSGGQGALLLSDGGPNLFSLSAGSGITPTWDGSFSLSNTAGDSLVFSSNGTIDSAGGFTSQAASYNLAAFGNAYAKNSLTMNNVGGTLVGGEAVSGVAGQFGFEHGASGPMVKGVFGANLK